MTDFDKTFINIPIYERNIIPYFNVIVLVIILIFRILTIFIVVAELFSTLNRKKGKISESLFC